jgi:hypothetical protein
MLLGMIRLLARLAERRRGSACVGDDSFLRPTPTPCLPTRNGARRIASPRCDTVAAPASRPATGDEGGWPEPFGPSLRQLWAELAQRQIRTVLIQETEHDEL